MRIAIGGISVENCTFSPLLTRLDDFVVRRADALLASERYPYLDEFDAEFLPTLHARAWPGGPVAAQTYARLKEEFLDQLTALGPVDGLYLDLHGAMYVEGLEDAEHDWVAAARRVVGPDCQISASMDLHGNLSARLAAEMDMLTAYRTAPHEDVMETRRKAVAMLVDCLASGRRPRIAHRRVPLALPGERTSTAVEPAASLYASLADIDGVPGVLDASLFVGFVWADEPRVGAAVAVTGFHPQVIDAQARGLAQRYWAARHHFAFAVPTGSMDDCILRALEAGSAPVFISDAGDNPTAGAVGDVPHSLERLLALDVPDAVLAAIPDARAVATCVAAGTGATVEVDVGGKLDRDHGPPLRVKGRVKTINQGNPSAGDQVVLQVEGVRVILTERRKPFTTVDDFTQVGIDPTTHHIVVVKLGYLFPELARIAATALLALTPGASDLDIPRLPFQRLQRPIFPLDPEMEWQVDRDEG